MALQINNADIHEIVTEAVATVRSEFAEKQVKLAVVLNAEQTTVSGDAVRLQQVFWNLLRNAAKFTPSGGGVTIETLVTDAGNIRIIVQDTEIGVSKNELARLAKLSVAG